MKGVYIMKKSYTCGLNESKPSNVLEREQFKLISPYIPTEILFKLDTFKYWHQHFFNDECMGVIYQDEMNWLKNNEQRRMFFEWWNGGCLYKWNEFTREHERNEQYIKYSKEDWDLAHSAILHAVGMGCG